MRPPVFSLILVALILFIISFFTARIYAYAFHLSAQVGHIFVIIALVLPILYLFTLAGARALKHFNRNAYTVINVLAGIYLYLFLGAVLLGLTSLGFLLAGSILPLSIAYSITGFAVLAALIGFIQATQIVVTHYTVTFPRAPASWNGKTAAMISDTHFGLVNYTKFADTVVNKILSLKPDFVLHAGDFYDGPTIDTAPITAVWEKLTAQVPLFYSPGNHEAYGDYEMFVNSVRAAGAVVLDNKMVEHDGVQIAGILYHGGKENPDVAKTLTTLSFDKSKATILINHPPTAFIAPHEHGVDLIVSGHTHRGQFWPFRYISHAVYGDYDYGMQPYKNLTSITSNGIGTYGPPMRLFNSPEIVVIHFSTIQ